MNIDAGMLEFIKSYSKAIEESSAILFAGAGLSKPAGYVNWKELLRDIASEIGLDVDKETDLIAVAQYHVNENGGNRGKINQVLIEEFTKDSCITENHRILANLPIKKFWTTNYDTLIEDALKDAGKRSDVKKTPQNLSGSTSNCDATVFKMHGDVGLSYEAVLTKDDYEEYNIKRELFTTALKGDLVNNTFLFMGFSFDDPNLNQILSRIRILLGTNQRQHYCLMKKVVRKDYENDEDFIYAQTRHNLKVNDLRRYNIKAIVVDEYDDMTNILRIVESMYKRKNIFISASASDYGTKGEKSVLEFATLLSKSIIKNESNIVTGFGLGIGSCIISGALEELYSNSAVRIEKRLKARPFPQVTTGSIDLKELWTKYRKDMLSSVGIAIFMFGNKFDSGGNVVDANGMLQEFDICKENGIVPIPVGVTGFTSRKLWDTVMTNFEDFVEDVTLRPLYETIGDSSKTDQEIIDCIITIVKKMRNGR